MGSEKAPSIDVGSLVEHTLFWLAASVIGLVGWWAQ